MALLRTDIERALDEIVSQEGGMRFQGLAVVLGKLRWPELIACERKKDLGLDAYAAGSLTPEKTGKGLASSITPTLKKVSGDLETAKRNFPDLGAVLFVTPAKVGNTAKKNWGEAIRKDYGLDLHLISREDIIITLMMPENATVCASHLYIETAVEPQVAELTERVRRAAARVTDTWAVRTKGNPLVDLGAIRLDANGAESAEVFHLSDVDRELSERRRALLEAPAGRGKTTTLIQIAQHARPRGTPFMIDLPGWISSGVRILEYLAGTPSFQAESLTAADLARAHETEPFLFLLNGWNEIAESNSPQASHALREFERDFPRAGIIVATRTHHLTPPLPGALRLRLLRFGRAQRAEYVSARVGVRAAELLQRIEADPSLDELTRSPFILSEVVSLFQAGVDIPTTKVGILAAVIRLQEEGEHRNPLQGAPLLGRQAAYLRTLAREMTRQGAVSLPEAAARALVAVAVQDLVARGQVEAVGPPAVLATLTAHHLLERIDYPKTAFRFEHQQFQEYYAALDIRARLLGLRNGHADAVTQFTADYVNNPAWAEPLRMIAETLAETTGNGDTDREHVRAGRQLVDMALAVDPVFAGELAQLCGTTVWNEVRARVGDRLRAQYALRDSNYRQCALAAMLATGSDDFRDIIVGLLSAEDRQARLEAYRVWPDVKPSSLGPDWRERVRAWSDEARADFVAELLHHGLESEVAAFAIRENSPAVKDAAASALLWTRSDAAAAAVLESMDAQTFEHVARKYADRMPPVLRGRTVAALRTFIETTPDTPARLRTALDLIELGEGGLNGVVRDALAALPGGDTHNLGSHYIKPALEHLRMVDPAWVSEWVAIQVGAGALHPDEYWLKFATAIPKDLLEEFLRRLESEDLGHARFSGMVAVLSAGADTELAIRVFRTLRELRLKVEAEPDARHEFEWAVIWQLEAVFRALPDDVAVAGIVASVTPGEPADIAIAAGLLSRVARSDLVPLHLTDTNLERRIHAYLTNSVDLVLGQDDFNGEHKAHLVSCLAQLGHAEDMDDLVRLIHADIHRMRRGRDARAAGDRGPVGNGAIMTQAGWNIAAVMQLDGAESERVLVHLLSELEYASDAAAAMARDFVRKREGAFDRTFGYELMRAAREGRIPPPADNGRRTRYAEALNAEIRRLLEQHREGQPTGRLKGLANALAAIDGHASAATVLHIIGMPGRWDEGTCVDAAERLLTSGVVLPAATAFGIVDSLLARAETWGMQDADKYLFRHALALCAFVDNPEDGITKIREAIARTRLDSYELREIVTALGECRSDAAVDLLIELAANRHTFEQCEDSFFNALAALDTPRSRELLLGLIDPDVRGLALTRRPQREDVLVARVTELARRDQDAAGRLLALCDRDLPELNRHILSKVMDWLGTPGALRASLQLIDDTKPSPIPQGIRDQLEAAFVERRPSGDIPNAFTQHARASNEIRLRLFEMLNDERRRRSAFRLLGQIEQWRLEHGRPFGEPRHPAFGSARPWPPFDIEV